MKTIRALLLMLAAAAGGVGLRLAFSFPATPEKSPHHLALEAAARQTANTSSQPAPAAARPQPSEILTATAGTRYRLLVTWLAEATAEELVTMADAFSQPPLEDYTAVRLLMVRWAEVHPPAMLEWARDKSKGRYNDNWFVDNAILAWARVDFDSAWAAACAGQPAARDSALLGLASSDPDKCLRLLRADPSLFTLTGMDTVLQQIAARDPAGAASLLDHAPASRRQHFTGGIARAWANTDPAVAVTWIKSLDSVLQPEALQYAGEWIATHAPEHLPSLLEGVPAGSLRSTIESAGLAQLAATDPNAARLRLDSMPPGPARQFGRGLLLKELVHRGDDTAAVAVASQLDWSLLAEWTPSHSESMYGSGLTLSSHSLDSGEVEPIRTAMGELLARIAARDPAQASAILAKLEPGHLDQFLDCSPGTHPAAMADLLILPGARDHSISLSTLAGNWMVEDPLAAVTWAAAHDSGRLEEFFHHWISDPAAALTWAATLPAERRQPLLQQTISSWATGDPKPVTAALCASSLPEAEKQELLGLLPSPP